MVTAMPASALSAMLLEPPVTLDPSRFLPAPLLCSLKVPVTLGPALESAFDNAFQSIMNDVRKVLLQMVQDVAEQQVSAALSQYSAQVSESESTVIVARRTILEDSHSVNEKFRKLQDLVGHNTKESSRLEEALSHVNAERARIHQEEQSLSRERSQLKTDRSQLQLDQGKLNARHAEIREERGQILQWQQVLSQKEQGLAARGARAEARVDVERAHQGGSLPAQPAHDSLQAAKLALQQAKVCASGGNDRSRPGIPGPMPVRMHAGTFSAPAPASRGLS